MTKSEQSQITKALATGSAEYVASTIATLQRCASAKSSKELINMAYNLRLMSFLTLVNGCLVRIN